MKDAPQGKEPESGHKRRRILTIVLRGVITLAVLGALINFLPRSELLAALRQISVFRWLTVLVGFVVGHYFAAKKWRILLRAAGFSCGSLEALRAHAAGLFANLCLPSIVGGDAVRAAILLRRGGAGAIATGGVADRILDTTALVVLGSIGASFAPHQLSASVTSILVFVALAIAVCAVLAPFGLRLLQHERLPGLIQRLARKIGTAVDALRRRPGRAFLGFLLSLCIQSGFVSLNAFMGSAVGIDVPLVVWFLAWPLAKLIALVPISLGGLGVREAALASLLAPFGVAPALAVAQGLLWQSILISTGLFAGLYAYAGRARNRPHDVPISGEVV